MQINPLIRREWRERWRRGRAFWLLLGYTSILAGMMYFLYSQFAPGSSRYNESFESSASFGRMTFVVLTGLQVVLWGLLTPSLTASAIAGERERGLLEALQLSHLTPIQIVIGKLGAVLLFCLLLLLTALPFSAICFLLGGISPTDYLAAIGFQLAAATTCASIGLWCSSWTRRANIALRSSLGILILWSIFSVYFFVTSRWPAGIPSFLPRPSPGTSNLFYEFIGSSNPLIILIDYYFPAEFNALPGATSVYWPTWAIGLVSQGTLCLLLFISTARAVYRPLGETYWLETKKRREKQREKREATAATKSEPGKSEPGKSEPTKSEPTKSEPTKKSTSGWWEIPVGHWIPAANPVLHREARGKFRMRQVPLVVLVFEALLGIAVLYFYLKTLWTALFDPSSRPFVWGGLSFFGLIVLMFSCAIMGATSLARERENGTWEALSLSLLSPAEIIAGKFGAALFACGVFSLPFLPLLLPCISLTAETSYPNPITPVTAGRTLLVLAGTAVSFTAYGMLWSWLGRRAASAVSWTLATLFLIEGLVPLLLEFLEPGERVFLLQSRYWSPFAALAFFAQPSATPAEQLQTTLYYAISTIAVTGGLLLLLQFLIRRELRR